MRSDIAQGNGIYKSSDGGRSWSAQRPRRLAADRAHPGPPGQSRRRLRGGARPSLRPERRARRLPLAATAAAAGAKLLCQGRRHRRHRPRLRAGEPGRGLRRAVADAAHPWHIYPPSNGPGSGLYKSTDGGEHWTRWRREQRSAGEAGPDRPRRGAEPRRGGSTRSSMRRGRRAASTARTTAARPGRSQRRRADLGARLVLRRHHRRPPKPRRGLRLQHRRSTAPTDGGKTFVPVKGAPGGDDYHTLWIDPRHPERRILGVDQGAVVSTERRRDLELVVQPADRAVLPRDHRQPLSLLGLRLAAGLRRGRRAQPHRRLRRHQPHRLPRDHGRRRERQHRARSRRTRTSSSAAGWTARPAHRADPLGRSHARLSRPLPRDLDAAAHLLAARSARRSTSRDQRLFRTADGGEHWTAISPDLTPREPGHARQPRSRRRRPTTRGPARAAA